MTFCPSCWDDEHFATLDLPPADAIVVWCTEHSDAEDDREEERTREENKLRYADGPPNRVGRSYPL